MKYSVLVIDDDKLVNEFLMETLKRAGYSGDAALTGEDGLNKFRADQHDIVMTDLKMPGMDGISVLEQIKKHSSDTPVVIMTAYGTVETAVKAIQK
ncbi:MAG: response regulator, partial [Candidatus Zixiibacteriota bacterium]